MLFRYFSNILSSLRSKSRVILYVTLIFSAIFPIALAIYYDQVIISKESITFEYLHERILSPILNLLILRIANF